MRVRARESESDGMYGCKYEDEVRVSMKVCIDMRGRERCGSGKSVHEDEMHSLTQPVSDAENAVY